MALEGDQRWSSSVVLKHCCPFYLLFWMLLHFLFMACTASPLFSKFVCYFPYLHGESNSGVTFHSPVARAEWCSPKYRASGTRGLAPARIPLLPRLSLASLLCRALQWRPGGRRWRGARGVIRNSSQSVSQSVSHSEGFWATGLPMLQYILLYLQTHWQEEVALSQKLQGPSKVVHVSDCRVRRSIITDLDKLVVLV